MPSKSLTRIKGRMNLDPPCLLSMIITFLRYSHSWRSGPVSDSDFVRVGILLIQDVTGTVPSINSIF
jgi:hypothetical protein